MTHERNVLMWLIGLSVGCATIPTAATRPHTANENLALEYAVCHTKYHQLPFEIEVIFTDHIREADQAVAWGWAKKITIVREALETWAPVDIEMVVGHEIAHAGLGIWDEEEATRIASDAYWNAGCH